MNAPTKTLIGTTTMSAREFNQHTSKAKQAAERGPVFITDRGKPAYVLLSADEFDRLSQRPKSAWEALAPRQPIEVELDDYLPKREVEPFDAPFDPEGE